LCFTWTTSSKPILFNMGLDKAVAVSTSRGNQPTTAVYKETLSRKPWSHYAVSSTPGHERMHDCKWILEIIHICKYDNKIHRKSDLFIFMQFIINKIWSSQYIYNIVKSGVKHKIFNHSYNIAICASCDLGYSQL
jgi:hypothetical protein